MDLDAYTPEKIIALDEEEFRAYAEQFADNMVAHMQRVGKEAGEAADPGAAARVKAYWDKHPKEKISHDVGKAETQAKGRQVIIDLVFEKWEKARSEHRQKQTDGGLSL